MAVHKKELVATVAAQLEWTKKQSAEAVDAVFAAVSDFLSKGEAVKLVGFGNFEVRDRAPRKGTDFKTGETIEIPATRVPAFKAGKTLKEAVK